MRAASSATEPRGTQVIHHTTAQRFGRSGIALAGRRQRRQKNTGVVVMGEAASTPFEVSSHVVHALWSQLLVEVIPELLNRSAAVDFAVAVSHASVRVGCAARSRSQRRARR